MILYIDFLQKSNIIKIGILSEVKAVAESTEFMYLAPDTPAEEVYGALITRTPKDKAYHTHNYCEVMLILDGEIEHYINSEVVTLKTGDICFIRASDRHKFVSSTNTVLQYFNMGIPESILNMAFSYYGLCLDELYAAVLPPFIRLSSKKKEELFSKIRDFKAEPNGKRHGIMMLNLVAEFLYIFFKKKEASLTAAAENIPQWLSVLLNEYEQEEGFKLGLAKLLELSHYNQSYLNRCFKKYLSTTPTAYINGLRVSHAKTLFSDNRLSLTDICYACGFQSSGSFYKEFKKITGLTPKEYLKREYQKNRQLI